MVEQGYNYLEGSIQNMREFFKTKIENLERIDPKKDPKKEKTTSPTRKGNIPTTMFLMEKVPKEQEVGNILPVSWLVWPQY